jgi:hypothetical protein
MRHLLPLTIAALAAPHVAFGHPGDHSDLSPAENAAHVVSDPYHIMLLVAAVAVVLVGGWAVRRAYLAAQKDQERL